MRMQRARLLGVRHLVFEEKDIDTKSLGARAIHAETECSAVSIGTETSAYLGDPPLRPGPIYPRLVGYCNVARVVGVGSEVKGVRVGQRILTHQSHQSGFVCDDQEILASLEEADCAEAAAISYLAQLGLAALQKGRFQPGETVVVLGLGIIGLATVGLAAALGAKVVALGNDASRLKKALEMGAHAALLSGDPDLLPRLTEATGGDGPDLIVTTANSWAAWQTALETARFQTRIAVLGFPGRTESSPAFNPLTPEHFNSKQLSILGAGMVDDARGLSVSPKLRQNMATILRLVRTGRLPLAQLVTHRTPWHQLGDIYETAARRDKTLIGAILDWRSSS